MTLCTFSLATSSPCSEAKSLSDQRNAKRCEEERRCGQKRQIGRERPHFFGFQPPKKFVGSLPPSARWSRAVGLPRREAATNL